MIQIAPLLADTAAAVTSSPDYTPALIGLGGVVIGGIIQIGFQWKKMREDQVQGTRERVAGFCHEATSYVWHLAQVAKAAREGELERLGPDFRQQQAAKLTENFRETRVKGFGLCSVSDRRVAAQAQVALNAIAAYSDGLEGMLIVPDPYADRAWPDPSVPDALINELLTMVYPRFYERHARFISVKRARKILAKEEADQLPATRPISESDSIPEGA